MSANIIPETTAETDMNRTLESQRQDLQPPVYHETMVACTPSPGFDNSVGLISRNENMESMDLGISQEMEKMGLEARGAMIEGIETGVQDPSSSSGLAGVSFKYETESGRDSGAISVSESTPSTATASRGNTQDDKYDEDEALEFERMLFNYNKAGKYFEALDWANTEAYLSAVMIVLDTHPKFETKFQVTDKFNIMSILVLCQTRQEKWNEVLNNIDIVMENAKVSTKLPEDLQSVIGTLENLRADAYMGLGDLENARVACKKAIQIRKTDSKRLGESVSLMVNILGKMGAEHDVEAGFYKALISQEPDVLQKEASVEQLKTQEHAQERNQSIENHIPVDGDAPHTEESDIENVVKDLPSPTFTKECMRALSLRWKDLKKAESYKALEVPGEPKTENLLHLSTGELLDTFGLKTINDPLGGKQIVSAQYSESEKGPEVLINPSAMRTVVHRTIVEEGHIEIAEALLKLDRELFLNVLFNVSSCLHPSDYGSPLHYAVIYGNLEIVALLHKYGVDFNSLTKQQFTAIHIAAAVGDVGVKMMELLIANGAVVNGPIVRQNQCNTSPLHALVLGDRVGGVLEKISLLLRKGADRNAVDHSMMTPLMMSVEALAGGITLALLEVGANANIKNNNGDTALHLAARFYNDALDEATWKEGHIKIEWLLMFKADKNLKNKMGKRPIDYVHGYDNLRMLDGILK
ncbi:ankyrin repeat domain 61 [Arthrobotrys conoides]|uniref:Ankyrin repeat domain 61 n=1 Tax=Arthrobotrys conoides TaxID=74498 RepID=A0AAN8S0V4_9PEZI